MRLESGVGGRFPLQSLAACALALALCAVLVGCSDGRAHRDEVRAACAWSGICDPAPAERWTIDVVCDRSTSSSCSRQAADGTIANAAAFACGRPGSFVRAWVLGHSAAETRVLGEFSIPASRGAAAGRTARTRVERCVVELREFFAPTLEQAFARPAPRRSPIADSIQKVALAAGHGLTRRIVLVTDARESNVADMECGRLPSEPQFAAGLRRRGVLREGSLRGIRVAFTYVEAGPISLHRCPVALGRELRIRELWRGALLAAGASDVTFDTAAVDLEHASDLAGVAR